jgi:pimeloyl-ACP methyl ester carboxylesterase
MVNFPIETELTVNIVDNSATRSTIDELRSRLTIAFTDPEAIATAAGLDACVRFSVGGAAFDLAITNKTFAILTLAGKPAIEIRGDADDWEILLLPKPPPPYHSFAALQLHNKHFSVLGDPLVIAQARACLESLFKALRPNAVTSWRLNLENIKGSYHRIRGPNDQHADVYFETSGQGPHIICLHTAGADSRQFHGLLGDADIFQRWRLTAFDLPFHGRSMPPDNWDGGVYKLDQNSYRDWCIAFIEQVVQEPVVLIGCSMGAAVALVLAAERPDLVRAVIALEAPMRARGRRNPYLTHVKVHGGWHSSAYVRGLLSPSSPAEYRRKAAWIYAQGAPGIYDGDLVFYSDQFDGEKIARQINGKRVPVTLMIGHYDFSATVLDADALAGWISNAHVVEMPDLGHFPMIENPPAFRRYLIPVLQKLRSQLDSMEKRWFPTKKAFGTEAADQCLLSG